MSGSLLPTATRSCLVQGSELGRWIKESGAQQGDDIALRREGKQVHIRRIAAGGAAAAAAPAPAGKRGKKRPRGGEEPGAPAAAAGSPYQGSFELPDLDGAQPARAQGAAGAAPQLRGQALVGKRVEGAARMQCCGFALPSCADAHVAVLLAGAGAEPQSTCVLVQFCGRARSAGSLALWWPTIRRGTGGLLRWGRRG